MKSMAATDRPKLAEGEPLSRRSPRRRLAPARMIVALCAAAVVASCSRQGPPPGMPVVAVANTERTTIANTMTLQAEFEPFQDVQIHGKVSGYVNLIRVDIGDRVKE